MTQTLEVKVECAFDGPQEADHRMREITSGLDLEKPVHILPGEEGNKVFFTCSGSIDEVVMNLIRSGAEIIDVDIRPRPSIEDLLRDPAVRQAVKNYGDRLAGKDAPASDQMDSHYISMALEE